MIGPTPHLSGFGCLIIRSDYDVATFQVHWVTKPYVRSITCTASDARTLGPSRAECEAQREAGGEEVQPEAEDDKTPAKAFSYARNAYAADGTTKADAPEIEITVETLNFLVSYFCDLHVDRCARPGRSASV